MPIYPPNFRGSVANAATKYVGIPIGPSGRVSIHIGWLDATTAGSFVFQTTQMDADEAPVEAAGSGEEWETESAVSIASIVAAAAGAQTVHVSNMGPNVRARLVFTATANSELDIRSRTE